MAAKPRADRRDWNDVSVDVALSALRPVVMDRRRREGLLAVYRQMIRLRDLQG